MKVFKKAICFVLALVTVFSIAAYLPANAWGKRYNDIYENGYSVPKTKDFMDAFVSFGALYERITGMKIFTDDKISIILEGFIKDVYDEVYTLSDATMDFELFFKSLPISSVPAKRFYELTRLDKDEVVEYLRRKNLEADENGDSIAVAYFFARVYMNLFDSVVIGASPISEEEGIYELFVTVYYTDGTYDEMTPGVYYNAKEDYLYNSDGRGVLELGYDLDADTATLYCVVDSWQRQFGFCMFYDMFSYLTPFFDYTTKRFKFVYEDKEWMIQIWKGRYLITMGCEIGIYTRDIGSKGSYYNCASDEDMLKMSMQLYHGDDLLVSSSEKTHWWLTAFRFTPKCYLPESLTMNATVEFKDEEMTDLFVAAASKQRNFEFTREGKEVSFVW